MHHRSPIEEINYRIFGKGLEVYVSVELCNGNTLTGWHVTEASSKWLCLDDPKGIENDKWLRTDLCREIVILPAPR